MRNFACWKSDEAYAIVNPDADAVPPHIFQAVHTDIRLQVRSRPDAQAEATDPESFLKRFLAPRDHVLVPVIGESGTGKSHLIRWMQLRLPETAERAVIFVPKAQTNLRDIVRALVDRLPETEKAQYTSELQGADSLLQGKKPQRTALLNQIQLAIQNDQGNDQTGVDPELEQYLLEGLRGVFLDPYLRDERFLSNTSFASDLAEHVFERPDQYRPAEQRRLFTISDLPLDVRGIQKAATATQEFLTFLVSADDAVKASAVAIINRNLDWAIARCLNISGDRLVDLMLGIRRKFKKENRSLVLLIEDFARLQGLDRALLQSLIEQRNDLCVLRTAFASTTGFYDTIAKTVLTRLTFVVDMTLPLGADGQGINLSQFTSRYMNALRLGEEALRTGLQNSKSADHIFSVENRCDSCEHKTVCHTTFGEADGFGLYPFTRTALRLMSERVDAEAMQRFNARAFQKAVLRPVALAASDLAAGRFPMPSLLTDLGGIRTLGPAEQNRLRSADAPNLQRRITLLELWDGEGHARGLSPSLQEAFGLPRLALSREVTPSGPKPPSELHPVGPRDRAPVSEKSDDRIIELTNWFNEQRPLSATTAGTLRQLLFKALDDAIDWNGEGLAQTTFRGTGAATSRPFVPSSIYFLKQTTSRVSNIVQIDIPTNWDDKDDRFLTVMALQGLLESEKLGRWDFEGGIEKLACLQECLSRWSLDIVGKIRRADASDAEWDPADCALSIRVAAALLTNQGASTRSDIDVVQVGLGQIAPTPQFATEAMTSLVNEIVEQDEQLLEIINSRRSAMKGSSPGNFMDTAELLKSVGAMRKCNFLPGPPPDKVTPITSLDRLGRLAKRVSSQLPRLVEDELNDRRKWLTEMNAAFGDTTDKQAILTATEELVRALSRMGLQGTTELAAARHAFLDSEYDEALKAVHLLPSHGDVRLNQLSRGIGLDMAKSRRLVAALTTALTRAEGHVAELQRAGGIDPDSYKIVVAEVDSNLARIEKRLNPAANG